MTLPSDVEQALAGEQPSGAVQRCLLGHLLEAALGRS